MKQRLVGTLVLGSLALILIPLLLDGEGVERAPLSGSIPPAPVFDTTPLPEPERPEILADTLAPADSIAEPEVLAASDLADADPASTDVASTAATDATTETPAADAAPPATVPAPAVTETVAAEPPAPAPAAQSISEPALDAAGLPEGWAVRLGVFGERANADRLQTRLVADGYKAYVRPVGVSTAVLIGPVLTQNEAVALQTELNGLKAKYQIDNVIVQRYDIAQ